LGLPIIDKPVVLYKISAELPRPYLTTAIPNLAIKPDGFPKYRQFSLIFKSATSLLHKIMPKPVRFGFEFGIADLTIKKIDKGMPVC
jgi:hypothetical protein